VARLALDSKRRGRTDREIEWLRRSVDDKDRFLAGVGHELRTPLTVVVGMLDLAADPGRTFTDEDRAELMTTARVHAQEIGRIVDDFVTAGRLAADALTVRSSPTALDPLVAKIVASAPTDPRLIVTAATDLGTCLGDGLRISQILANLLGNALRNARSLVEIVGHVDDRYVTVEVCNNGPAVPTERSLSLFEPFMTVRPEGQPQPVGLGLSVSRALARRMGGDLIYQWRDGQVVFSLSLPIVPSPALVAAA
jgi:K+-sensing histidine kinase KdpD